MIIVKQLTLYCTKLTNILHGGKPMTEIIVLSDSLLYMRRKPELSPSYRQVNVRRTIGRKYYLDWYLYSANIQAAALYLMHLC